MRSNMNPSSQEENKSNIEKNTGKFVWGQGALPSQNKIKEYEEKKEQYDHFVENYRATHNGENPPPYKGIAFKVITLPDEAEFNYPNGAALEQLSIFGKQNKIQVVDQLKADQPMQVLLQQSSINRTLK